MNTNNIQANGHRLRILVAITSFGDKNLGFLRRIIPIYQKMPMEVEIVVLSNNPKDLGPGIKVIVGLPSPDPWSLPFAHKAVFAENADRYDLFIYSEEDIEITEEKIKAFLQATPALEDDEIAGFQLYEFDGSGRVTLPGVHGSFRWKPESVRRRGPYLVAEFTNEHSACYLLTRAQLKRCIASGQYLQNPHDSRFDMACTASTDPYTCCGFKKVLCVSAIDDFLLHHLPDRYAGKLGVSLEAFKEQIQTLVSIHNGAHPAATLCPIESRLLRCRWSKSLYEEPNEKLLKLVPAQAKTMLSIGCGWGAFETELMKRGVRITALPLDSVIGAQAARSGIEIVHGSLEQGMAELGGRKFDCVLMSNLLHLLPNPGDVLAQCSGLVSRGGVLIANGPNLRSLRVRAKRMVGKSDFRKLGAFDESGISVFGPATLARRLKRSGFQAAAVHFGNAGSANGTPIGLAGFFPGFAAEEWVLEARR